MKKLVHIFMMFAIYVASSFGYTYAFYPGVGVHPNEFKGSAEELIMLMKKYDIKSFRTDYPWSKVELQKGVLESSKDTTDKIINIAKGNGISPLIILDYGNKNYGGGKPVTPEALDAFVNYATWTARHFKGKAEIFEVWNEWSHRTGKSQDAVGEVSAEAYFQLVKATSLAVKKENPKAIVIAGGFNPLDNADKSWGVMLVKLGILNYIDGISLHPYSYQNRTVADPNFNLKRIDLYQDELSQIVGRKIPFYITEVGYPAYNGGANLSDAEVAQYAYEYITAASQMNYVAGVWWYDFIDDGVDKNNREYNFGILNNDLSEKLVTKEFSGALKEINSNSKN
ncbi:cellulase family glycosylhydrolase [Serratia proteamaculans]|uniref:cellulase family glycosylhydrolase n=1 Tax=Serratia proteamaculans TaxID=28151 RepID=UPI002178E5AF|nr:cellulase family glycosylhydrolase [Serratia proteamaculans]CAI1666216.1 Beta-xylosidase [Serratia proteamaculans]